MGSFAAAPETSATFLRGVRLHNAGAFFEAHEAWEELWSAEVDEAPRRFLQGLIQITAAFHKLFVQRAPGSARALLARGLTKLDPYPSEYLGVALGEFRDAARACVPRIACLETHPAGIDAFDRTTLPQLRFAGDE
jgi:predicted metal-dependent hydrolase